MNYHLTAWTEQLSGLRLQIIIVGLQLLIILFINLMIIFHD